MANKPVAEGKQLIDLGGGAFAEGIVLLGPTGAQIATAAGMVADTELPAAAALSDADGNPTTPTVGADLMIWTGSVWRRATTAGNDAMNQNAVLAVGLARHDGTSSFIRWRMPAVFKVVALGAGTAETTIWTPSAGKKFRLMGAVLTPGAASTLTFKDNTAGTTIAAGRSGLDNPWYFDALGNGILSGAANNVLTVTRGTSCTLDGMVWGTEE